MKGVAPGKITLTVKFIEPIQPVIVVVLSSLLFHSKYRSPRTQEVLVLQEPSPQSNSTVIHFSKGS